MRKIALFLISTFISVAAFAQEKAPAQQPERKVFPIHTEKRELKHECKGKHHDFRKNQHHQPHGGVKHPNKSPNHHRPN
jgi:hypothetical protein